MAAPIYTYRKILAALLLALYSFFSGAGMLCHHHPALSNPFHHTKKNESLAKNDQRVTAPCKVCDHHLADLLTSPDTITIPLLRQFRFIHSFPIRAFNFNSHLQKHDAGRGPPAGTCSLM